MVHTPESQSIPRMRTRQTRRTHSAGTGRSMRREPIVENNYNTHALPDWPLRVQARETVHNLLGYKNKFMTNKPKDSMIILSSFYFCKH